MNLIVLTPGKKIYSGGITSVKVPGTSGEFEVLKGHAAIVSSLKAGKVRIKKSEGGEMSFGIENGFIEVLKDEVSLLIQGYQE
ncbi:ATP synthase F1 subunit epsilon [Portibacter marinus]|uniref:ATP synthase F1 subunit epsilon n=1 Tax=Portibacter marinus TaxID=2898660 RepID=UPI001F45CB13|nr:ATP synthase F1 subunit epsilon [Portibacter marinus]